MSLNRSYYRPVTNNAGYVLMFPNVGDEADLIQSHPPNPYAQSVTRQFPLGTWLIQGEREWRYCKNAAVAITIAQPLQSAARIHAEADYNIVVGAVSAIGATTVTLTSTANLATAPLSTKDGFAEGYISFNTAAGQGQHYKIKSHEAASSTSNFIVTLYDPLTVALTTSSKASLTQNPYSLVVATAAVLTGMFVGIAQLAITASYYFWSQVHGPATVIANAAIALGTTVVVGTTAAKADPGAAATTEVTIGYPLTTFTTADHFYQVFLTGH